MYRILVVEDDEVIAKTIRQHLQSWNYEVFAVADFNSDGRICPGETASGTDGYKASVSQWILLVHGDPESIKAADDICLFDE